MFTDDKSIEDIRQLFREVKKYLLLQKEYTRLEVVEKLTVLLSTFIVVFVLIILSMITLFYLLFALVYILAPHVGGLTASFGLIACIPLMLIIVATVFRKRLITFCLRVGSG